MKKPMGDWHPKVGGARGTIGRKLGMPRGGKIVAQSTRILSKGEL